MSIEIGSLWKEHDNRFHRVVEVVGPGVGSVLDPRIPIRTVEFRGQSRARPANARVTYAKSSAFGKRYRAYAEPQKASPHD